MFANEKFSEQSLLSTDAIERELGDSLSASVKVHLHSSTESTNTCLLQHRDKASVQICATEVQTEGRGRRGKVWSTPARGVTFSMKLTVPVPMSQIGGASLICGVAVCETFHDMGITQANVKWPNDILVANAKLAGILVEVAAHSASDVSLVIGVGINYRIGAERQQIDREIIDLSQLFDGDPPARSALIGKICSRMHNELISALPLKPSFIDTWREIDALSGESVLVCQGSGSAACGESVAGQVAGIDSRGYLVLETDSGTRFYSSAEVTIQRH